VRILSSDFLKLSDPIWVGDLGTEAKNGFFYIILVLISMAFGSLPLAECSITNFFKAKPLKVVDGYYHDIKCA
jgi:hypothetical protein